MAKEETLNGDPKFAEQLRRAYAERGFRAVIEAELKSALDEEKNKKYVNPVGVADAYAELGDSAHALQWLQRGYEAHASGMQYLAISRGLDPIRTDPQFGYWLTVLNLPTLKRPVS
jgi:ActR/RegA family two-component response regulator